MTIKAALSTKKVQSSKQKYAKARYVYNFTDMQTSIISLFWNQFCSLLDKGTLAI